MLRLISILGLLLALGACQKDTARLAEGAERGPCYGNGTCDEGLWCLSDLCVRPPPADCAKVADKLGNLLLSNYAPREERAAFVGEMKAACDSAQLAKEDGDCILGAADSKELAECPQPLGMGDCERVLEHVEQVLAPTDERLARELASDRDEMLRECRREAITKVEEACILAARDTDALERCVGR